MEVQERSRRSKRRQVVLPESFSQAEVINRYWQERIAVSKKKKRKKKRDWICQLLYGTFFSLLYCMKGGTHLSHDLCDLRATEKSFGLIQLRCSSLQMYGLRSMPHPVPSLPIDLSWKVENWSRPFDSNWTVQICL